jgi:hypothetical protein
VALRPLVEGEPCSLGLAFFLHVCRLPFPLHVWPCDLFMLSRVFEMLPLPQPLTKNCALTPPAGCHHARGIPVRSMRPDSRHSQGPRAASTPLQRRGTRARVRVMRRRTRKQDELSSTPAALPERNGTGDEGATQNDPGDMVCDDEGGGNGDVGPVDSRPSIGAYMSLLDQQGTLDSAHIVRHRAPRRSMSPEERAVTRFLRATERGVLAQAGRVAPATRSLIRPQGRNVTAGTQQTMANR